MKLPTETFFERIRNRLKPEEANRVIRTLKKAAGQHRIDYMAVKEASELLDRARRAARLSIQDYRQWEAHEAVISALQPTRAETGRQLREQARVKASLYLDAMRNYRDLVRLACEYYGGHSNDNRH